MQELRTTTGQSVRISYDPNKNALTFREYDWFADPLRSSAVPVKSEIVRPLGDRTVVVLSTRRVRRAA
jgi:hypothetical protein